MTKEVLLSLKGLQTDSGVQTEDEVETITPAEYYMRNGSHYVVYEEVVEGFEETTRNMVKFKESCLEVTKKGLLNVHLVFEENKKNMTSYATPYGNILIGIDTGKITLKQEEDHIHLEVFYTLEANYQYLADRRIEMNICTREKGMGFL